MSKKNASAQRLIATAVLLLSSASAFAVPSYTFKDLGEFQPFGLNDLGTLVGSADRLDPAQPRAINNAGVSVGFFQDRAAQWQGGQLTLLSELPGSTWSSAEAINNQGDIVGSSRGAAVIWHNGQISELASAPEGPGAGAYGINEVGTIVGAVRLQSGRNHAAIWENGVASLLPLPSYLLPASSDTSSYALGINNQNTVVGSLYGYATSFAAAWTNGQLQVLPPVTDAMEAWASGINDMGQIVGTSSGSTSLVATLWEDGIAYDLGTLTTNAPGWHLRQAYGINELGQIYGTASYGNGGPARGFLLTPTNVPEADASIMGLLGLLGVGMWRVKRNKPAILA